jgi:signal transduction histidine kinase
MTLRAATATPVTPARPTTHGRGRWLGLRGRIVASFLVLLALAELASLVVLHQVGAARVTDQADAQLVTATTDLRTRVEAMPPTFGQPGGPTLGSVFDDELRARPARQDQAVLTFVGGRPYAASAGAPVALDQLPVAGGWASTDTTRSGEVDTAAGPMRWMAVPVQAGGTTIGVFVATAFVQGQLDTLAATERTVAIVTGLILVAACLLAWGLAGRALAPMHELTEAATAISDHDDLDTRIDAPGHDEVAQLAEAFNGMVDRLRDAFAGQKQFLDDAGHELRTPITIVRGHLELLGDDPDEQRATVELVLDELDRMERLVEDLRLLARSERPDFLAPAPVDVATLLVELGAKVTALADRRWAVHTDVEGTVVADRSRLTEAALNLVDNAVRATGDGDAIELGARRAGDALELWVADTGTGIDPDDLPTLFERTDRRVRRRISGTGLGLPIVAAIARAHGGDVRADSTPGVGTTVTITIPWAAPPPADHTGRAGTRRPEATPAAPDTAATSETVGGRGDHDRTTGAPEEVAHP